MILWPIIVYFGVVLFLMASIITVSYFLGQRHREHATGSPYESGILSEGSARLRLSANFYLITMFFVVFDLESAFIFAWAVAARRVGWPGYWEVLTFVAILLVGLGYLWRLGALDWNPKRARVR